MAVTFRLTFRATLVAALIGGLTILSLGPARQAYEQRRRIDAEQVRLAALRAENLRLRERLDRLNDPSYLEKLARKQVGLVKPGEISYVVVPPPTATATAGAPVREHLPWYRSIWVWLKAHLPAT